MPPTRLPLSLKEAFRYNAWAFVAECTPGSSYCTQFAPTNSANNGTVQGTPGSLILSGAGDGTYDACPAHNVESFIPNLSTSLGGIETFGNALWVSSCNQDLRQDFVLHLTKANFTVWNSAEVSFTGAFECIDSNALIPLVDANSSLTNPSNFDVSTLRTDNARFSVKGISSTQCPGVTENVGLLGVFVSMVGIGGDPAEDDIIGGTTHAVGTEAGFVLWDTADTVGFAKHHKR
jgi:hypothetical protein